MTFSHHLRLVSLLILVSTICWSKATTTTTTKTTTTKKKLSTEACIQAGFDPSQLSCKTCDLLPNKVATTCKLCCRSYLTLKKRTQRYEVAVLFYYSNAGYFPEINQFIEEDLETLLEKKGAERIVLKQMDPRIFQGYPPLIFWYEEVPTAGGSDDFNALQSQAIESIVLDGWKRDDIRDMLTTLLPDK